MCPHGIRQTSRGRLKQIAHSDCGRDGAEATWSPMLASLGGGDQLIGSKRSRVSSDISFCLFDRLRTITTMIAMTQMISGIPPPTINQNCQDLSKGWSSAVALVSLYVVVVLDETLKVVVGMDVSAVDTRTGAVVELVSGVVVDASSVIVVVSVEVVSRVVVVSDPQEMTPHRPSAQQEGRGQEKRLPYKLIWA